MVRALLDAITHDAVVNVPGQNIAQGRKAAEAALRAAIPTPADATFDRSTYTGNVSHDGLLGYTFGRGTAQLRQADGSVLSRYTLYITAWRREGVHWRVEATMWNYSTLQPTDPPPGLAIFEPGDRGTPRWAPRHWNAASALLADRNFADLSVEQGYTVAFTAYVAEDGSSVAGPVYWGADEVIGIAWAGWTPVETLSWTPTILGFDLQRKIRLVDRRQRIRAPQPRRVNRDRLLQQVHHHLGASAGRQLEVPARRRERPTRAGAVTGSTGRGGLEEG